MTFTVHLAGSDRHFAAGPHDTLLAAGLRQGLALPFGCQSGSCGSCRVRLVTGTVEPPAAAGHALSDAEVRAGYILLCQAGARSDLEIVLHQPPEAESLRPRMQTAKVIEQRALSHDVIGLWLKLPPGKPFRFLPGQYVDFLLPDGRRRSFSIARHDAADRKLEFHLRVTPDGHFAHYVRDQMPARTLLQFEGPLGAFYLREGSLRPALLVAGGTGFAPIKAILERALAARTVRPLHLYWGARRIEDLYLDELARRWAASHRQLHYTPVLSEPEPGWSGATGLVHDVALAGHPDLRQFEAYLAGPPAMVHAAKQAFPAAGLDPANLFYDSFDYAHETWPALG